MSKAEVVMEFGPDGSATVEVNGGVGPACTDLTAELEDALGQKKTRTRKREYGVTVRKQPQTVSR